MHWTPGQIGVSQRALGAPCADRERSLARGRMPAAAAFAGHGPVLSRTKVQVEDIPPTRAKAP